MGHTPHAYARRTRHAQGGVRSDPPPKRVGGERVGQRMAEAKGINSEEITLEVTEEVKELASEVKEATAEVMDKVLIKKGAPQQLVSLRETVSSEGFDEKRGLRRIMALWGSTNSPF